MAQKKIIKYWLLFGTLSGAIVAPITVAASCGESAKSPEVDTAFLSKIAFESTSTNDNVSWKPLPSDTKIANANFYYTDNAQTLETVKALPSTSWSQNLPSAVHFDHAKRQLWVKLTPALGNVLTNNIINITQISKIATIKSNINTLSEYKGFNLKVQVNLNPAGTYTLNEAVDIPQGSDIVYSWQNKPNASLTDLKALIATKPLKATLESVKARLKVADESKYVLSDNKKVALFINEVTRVVALSNAEKAELNKIQLESENDVSTHNALVWKALPALPANISSIAYLSGNYATEEAAMNAPSNEWKSALPPAIDYHFNRRNLWARLTPTIGIDFQTHYLDISRSSGVRYIPNLLDAIDPIAYAKIDLSKVVVSGTWTNPVITVPESAGFILPAYLQILLGFDSFYSVLLQKTIGTYRTPSLENYTTEMNSGKVVITNETAKGFYLYLDLNDSQESDAVGPYVIKDDKKATPQLKITKLESKKLMTYFNANGTHGGVTWSEVPLPYGFESIEFFSGNFTTKEAVIASGTASIDLPSVVDPIKANRHLWVKITPKDSFELEDNENYIDITASSGIQTIE